MCAHIFFFVCKSNKTRLYICMNFITLAITAITSKKGNYTVGKTKKKKSFHSVTIRVCVCVSLTSFVYHKLHIKSRCYFNWIHSLSLSVVEYMASNCGNTISHEMKKMLNTDLHPACIKQLVPALSLNFNRLNHE